MARNTKSAECRDPDAVGYLMGLPVEDAKLHPPVIRRREGGYTAYWREGGYTAYWRDGGRVSWREITAGELREFGHRPVGPSAELDALLADARARFAELMPKLSKEAAQAGADMDSIERALRDGCLDSGAAGLKALLETVDAGLGAPECERCGRRMVRHRRTAKTFTTRLGDIEVVRTHFLCRDCGNGFCLLDRMIGAEGDNFTAGAASIIAEAAAVCGFAPAARLLGNLAGVGVSASAFQRRAKRIGGLVERFEREVVEGGAPAAELFHLAIDGTGVPMRKSEVEGVKGKQVDGSSRTAEAKAAVVYTAVGRDPRTGEPRKDRGSETVSAAIDSAAAVGGLSSRSDFAARLGRLVHRMGLRDAGEIVVLSDGAPWIRNVCGELLAGQRVTFVLDLWHALDYAGAALRALVPDGTERKRRMGEIKADLKAGRVHDVIAWLEPHRDRDPAVAACIDCYTKNRDRMRYDECIRRGIQIGSGVVESLGRQRVGKRLKQPGSHWSKDGANRLLAIKLCPHNNRRADFLDWKANLAVAA